MTTTPPTVLVVVPTYNERENLPLLARGVLVHPGFRMLVVDDGSPDGTGAVADALAVEYPGRVEVMHRTGQRGLGRSYIDGLQKAIAQPDVDLVCQMDADLSHNPEYLPALVAATTDHDVVIGSRYLNGVSVVNWPLHRIFLSAFANRYIRTGHEPDAARLHERLPVLAARVAGAAALDKPWSPTATRFSSRCSSRRAGAAAVSAKSRSFSSSGVRASRKYRARCSIESLITPWRLVFRKAP